jgi:hypothetical protein
MRLPTLFVWIRNATKRAFRVPSVNRSTTRITHSNRSSIFSQNWHSPSRGRTHWPSFRHESIQHFRKSMGNSLKSHLLMIRLNWIEPLQLMLTNWTKKSTTSLRSIRNSRISLTLQIVWPSSKSISFWINLSCMNMNPKTRLQSLWQIKKSIFIRCCKCSRTRMKIWRLLWKLRPM